MRIVNAKEFLALPAHTVYHEYEPFSPELMIKGDTLSAEGFQHQGLALSVALKAGETACEVIEKAEAEGVSVKMDFDGYMRDYADPNWLFAVLEKEDVAQLIERLSKCLE